MPQFHDVRFPIDIGFGATGGPQRKTQIVSTASGAEFRNARWVHSRRSYNAGFGIKTFDQLAEVISFFEQRRGSLHAFRFRDPVDFKSCTPSQTHSPMDQVIGTGDGVSSNFKLIKTYGEGEAAYIRPISHPVLESLMLAIDGNELSQEGYEWDGANLVLDTPPADGAIITAGFHFDVQVRFDADDLSINMAKFAAGEIPSVPLVEVRV